MLTDCAPWPGNRNATRRRPLGVAAEHALRIGLRQQLRCASSRSRHDQRPAVAESAAAGLQRERHVGQVDGLRRPARCSLSCARRAIEGRRGARREHEQLLDCAPAPPGSAAGASSSTTCAFVPPTPNELTPARRGVAPDCHGCSGR